MSQAARSLSAVPKPRGIFDPVARGLDVIGDRWSLVLMRHLLKGHLGFQDLRKRTGIAPRVLSSRLRQLVSDGFVETVADGSRSVYALSAQGRSLEPIIVAIGRWWIQHGLKDLDVDARAFAEPFRFDIARSPNRHVGYGFGPHICLGAGLARLELRLSLEVLLERIAQFELAGETRYTPNNRLLGLKSLPVNVRKREEAA